MDNKQELMDDLNINNATYDKLAKLAMRMAVNESECGDGDKYWVKENMPFAVSAGKWWKNDTSAHSRGMTQMKLEGFKDEKTIEILEKYGINPGNLKNPANSAKATMVVLASIYKNELPAFRPSMNEKNISDEEALSYIWTGRHKLLRKPKEEGTENKELKYFASLRKNDQYFTFATA
jgi:hypothetical protein